jgi:hypothetical protein
VTAFPGQNPLGLGGIRKPINAIRLYLVFSKRQGKSARSAALRQNVEFVFTPGMPKRTGNQTSIH